MSKSNERAEDVVARHRMAAAYRRVTGESIQQRLERLNTTFD
jgi:hypothetical protein